MSYESEAHLVRCFRRLLEQPESPFPTSRVAFEFYYMSGKTDVVAATEDGDLLAFEAKLADWRKALAQAYRSTSFCHFSYVVMPSQAAVVALRNEGEFRRRRVGLCSVSENGVHVHIAATRREPIQPWLTGSAMEHIAQGRETDLDASFSGSRSSPCVEQGDARRDLRR